MKFEFITVGDLPEYVLNDIKCEIEPYSISMLGLHLENNNEKIELIGSGTLVKFNNAYGILTACHLIESKLYKKSEFIGFQIKTQPHAYKIKKEKIIILEKIKGKNNANGPDLAIFLLPFPEVE